MKSKYAINRKKKIVLLLNVFKKTFPIEFESRQKAEAELVTAYGVLILENEEIIEFVFINEGVL